MRGFFTGEPVGQATGSGQHVGLGTMVGELLLATVAVLVVAKLAAWVLHEATKRVHFSYLPFNQANAAQTVVTDCTAPKKFITLSHHKGHNNPHGLRQSDTSTGLVINAIKARYLFGGEVYTAVQRPYITSNHFDVDSFLSVWCYCNRQLAVQYEPVLRHMARIGDFREALLSPEAVAAHGSADAATGGGFGAALFGGSGGSSGGGARGSKSSGGSGARSGSKQGLAIRDAYTALKLCCWLNTLEKRLFSAPYESKDCEAKLEHFLPRFAAVLADPESAWSDWQDEYKAVVGGYDSLAQGTEGTGVEIVKKVGLAIIQCPEPLHYYSLFSHTIGCDVVLMMYDRNRYEVECKYTQFVNVHSRPVWPRLDMGPLASVLNSIELALPPGVAWVAARFTDTGPQLRLEQLEGERLTKAQRYGHPYERPFLESSVPPATMAALVQSFLEFGLQGIRPKRGGWSWDELHALNQAVPWQTWINTVLEQHDKGQLGGQAPPSNQALANSPSRRVSQDPHALPLEPPPAPQAFIPVMSDGGSSILNKEDVAALVTGGLPARYCRSRWDLAYCTQRDGISLHTLYRKAAGKSPTLLIIKDQGGYVFGAFVTEPWHIALRFYGTGETCVFQLHPRRVLYPWQRLKGGPQNDFFQFSQHEGLGVGGAGHFAFWLDTDLYEGTSASCNTFGSPCLASANDFHVQMLELWHLSGG